MKFNSMKLIVLLTFLSIGSCAKDDPGNLEQSCNLRGENILNVKERTGILVYTDSISGAKLDKVDFFINGNDIDGVRLPLQVCNFPKDRFAISQGDSIPISFSGRIELLPNTVDALSLVVELSTINSINH